MSTLGKLFALACVGIGLWDSALSQDHPGTGDPASRPNGQTSLPRYVKVAERVEVQQNEQSIILEQPASLDDGSTITTQGLITRKNGEEILLGEKDSVGANGIVIPAGAGMDYIGPKYDKMWRVIDGRAVIMIKDTVLPNGLTVTMTGEVIAKDNTRTKIPDGQVIGMDGQMAAGVIDVDSVTMKDGKIWISRSGEAKLMVRQTTLDDESRLQPDGNLIRPDGSSFQLTEGVTILENGEVIQPERGRIKPTVP